MRFKQARAKAVMNIMQSGIGQAHPKAAIAATMPFRHPYMAGAVIGGTMLSRRMSRDPQNRFRNGRSVGRVYPHSPSSGIAGLTGHASGSF